MLYKIYYPLLGELGFNKVDDLIWVNNIEGNHLTIEKSKDSLNWYLKVFSYDSKTYIQDRFITFGVELKIEIIRLLSRPEFFQYQKALFN